MQSTMVSSAVLLRKKQTLSQEWTKTAVRWGFSDDLVARIIDEVSCSPGTEDLFRATVQALQHSMRSHAWDLVLRFLCMLFLSEVRRFEVLAVRELLPVLMALGREVADAERVTDDEMVDRKTLEMIKQLVGAVGNRVIDLVECETG